MLFIAVKKASLSLVLDVDSLPPHVQEKFKKKQTKKITKRIHKSVKGVILRKLAT